MSERTPNFFARKRAQAALVFVSAPAAIGFVSCGGGEAQEPGSADKTAAVSGTLTTIAGEQATKDAQPKTAIVVIPEATVTPKPTEAPIPTPTPEPVLPFPQLEKKISESLAPIASTNLEAQAALGYLERTKPFIDSADKSTANAILNGIGQMGQSLTKAACTVPDGKELADAANASKVYYLDLGNKFADAGLGIDKTALNQSVGIFFTIPSGCKNVHLGSK